MTLVPGWRRLFRLPFRTRQSGERDVEEELSFHLEMRAEKLRRLGLDDARARQAATARFGDASVVRDECLAIDAAYAREMTTMDWLESLASDFRYGLRALRRRPTFTAVGALTLALGIGATAAVFSLVDGVLLRPLPFKDPSRLVFVRQSFPEKGLDDWTLSQENVATYRDRIPAFQSFTAYTRRGMTVDVGGQPRRIVGALVTGDFFGVLGVDLAAGRAIAAGEDAPGKNDVAVLSYAFWQSVFGGARSAVGTTIDVDGQPIRIVGVAPAGFEYPSRDVQLYMPLGLDPTRRFGWFLSGVGRLRPGASVETARVEGTSVMREWAGGMPGLVAPGVDPRQTRMRILVTPLRDSMTGDVARPLSVLQAAVAVLLLIAIANVATLLLGRASTRHRELSMRLALGATTGRIARQLVTESLALASIGGVLGIGLAVAFVRGFTHSGTSTMPRIDEIAVNWRVLAFGIAVSVVSGLLFGVAPALAARRARSLAQAGSQREAGGVARRLNDGLVVAQLGLSFVLLVSAGLVLKSFQRLLNTDLGFEPANVTSIALPLPMQRYMDRGRLLAFTSDLLPRIAATPGVRGAGLIYPPPYSGGVNTDGYLIEGHAPPALAGSETQTVQVVVSPGTFAALRMPLRYGRDFDASDVPGSQRVVVVDEALADRYWKGAEAIGKRMRLTGDTTWFTIVGVVGSVRDEDVATEPRPHSYFPISQDPTNRPALVVRTAGDNASAVASVRATIARMEPLVPLDDVHPLGASISRALENRRITQLLLAGFAIAALVLAAIGIYGVMSLYVVQRRREFGVRLAVGAEPRNLLVLVLKQGARFALGGLLLGGAVAFLGTRSLGAMLYQVHPDDPIVFASLAVVLAAVAIVSCFVPARRAARSDPLEVLRSD